jgi:hypothetical protein
MIGCHRVASFGLAPVVHLLYTPENDSNEILAEVIGLPAGLRADRCVPPKVPVVDDLSCTNA